MVYRDGKKIDSPEGSGKEDSDAETTLIPKSLLPDGVKAGDEVRLKIVHGFDEEYEVEYVHSDNEKTKDENAPPEEGMEEISADA